MRHTCRQPERIGVRQPAGQRGQLDILALLGCGCVDLRESVLEHIGLTSQLRHPAGAVPQCRVGSPPLLVGGPVVDELDPGEAIQGGALLGRPGEPKLVGLTVHGEQPLREVTEHGDRSSGTTDVGPRAAGRAHGPAQHQRRAVIEGSAGISYAGRHVIVHVLDPTIDARLLRTDADPCRVSPTAEQQQEAGHHHGLARAGLAGDDGESRAERQDGIVDDAEAADVQFVQHGDQSPGFEPGSDSLDGAASRKLRTGSWNFVTSRSAKFHPPSRATRTGSAPRRTRTCALAGTS